MQLFAKYAVNQSKCEVQMIDGTIKIAIGGWEGLTIREIDHIDVLSAYRKGWIDLKDEEPKTPRVPAKEKVTLSDPTQGKTIEQVKAQVVRLGPKEESETPAAKVRKTSQKALEETVKKE